MADLRLANLAQALSSSGVIGVAVPDWSNKSTWQIQYAGGPFVAALTDPTVGSIIQNYDTTPPTPNPTDQWDGYVLRLLFNHENRIRALESKQPITAAQFKNAIAALP